MIETKMLDRLKKYAPHIMWQGIESTTGLGIPDSWFSFGNANGWTQLKELSRVPKDHFKMPWRPGQLGWYKRLRNRYFSIVPYYIILTLDKQWYVLDSSKIEMKETYTMEEIEPYFCFVDSRMPVEINKLTNRLI